MTYVSSDYHREWYNNNREKRSEYFKSRVICECGCEVSRGSLSTHRKSPKHKKLMDGTNEGGYSSMYFNNKHQFSK